MDNILLGVIGILEAMRGVDNVPAWVRAGHIHTPDNIQETPSHEVTLADLPSHEGFVPWFKDAAAHRYWVERGKEALERRGIPVSHDLMPDGHGATPERIALERAHRLSESQPDVPSSDSAEVEQLLAPEASEAAGAEAAAAPQIPKKATSKRAMKKQAAKLERRRQRQEWARIEALNAENGREGSVDSVLDEPRDDVPPGSEPAPFFVQRRSGRDTVAASTSTAAPGRSYSTQAARRSQPARPTTSTPSARTYSPSPERGERAYSPSMPV
jgi:hypothetical protein